MHGDADRHKSKPREWARRGKTNACMSALEHLRRHAERVTTAHCPAFRVAPAPPRDEVRALHRRAGRARASQLGRRHREQQATAEVIDWPISLEKAFCQCPWLCSSRGGERAGSTPAVQGQAWRWTKKRRGRLAKPALEPFVCGGEVILVDDFPG